jgi:hypothetical protein
MAAQNQHDADRRNFSQQLLAGLAMASQVALHGPTPGGQTIAQPGQQLDEQEKQLALDLTYDEHQTVLNKLVSYVNLPAGNLDTDSELYLEEQLSEMLGFSVRAELAGHRLNQSIGIMGSEQHLLRYPGDTLAEHDAYQEAGIAPNRGAFSWFTENGQLTEEAVQREKYYFAVQLMYLPDWSEQASVLKPWYKYRKMVVINPSEQVAVVGVVADAGPALWVQKQFGGSPEVVREGKIWSPKTRGKVMLLFVDDPNDSIPLGPISLDYASTLARSKAKQQLAISLLQ